jgi:3-hydroxyisobutyrate dehydrogenase-like beta-hydroxyacid dehydrogenase
MSAPLVPGAAAKLVVNAALFGTLGTLGEAIALAQGLGRSREATHQVLSATEEAGFGGRDYTALHATILHGGGGDRSQRPKCHTADDP